MANETTTEGLQDLQTTIDTFEGVLKTGSSNKGSLWMAWHYLQIYSIWGLRLPTSEISLIKTLGIDKNEEADRNDPSLSIIHQVGTYSFFPAMLESYQKVYEASAYFNSEVFPTVVSQIGNALKNFAKSASEDQEAVFSAILKMIKQNDTDSALELVIDLQKKADENVGLAENVADLLSTYATKLTEAKSALETADGQISEDDKVNDDRIAQLEAGSSTTGSIEYLKYVKDLQDAEYKHDVLVATTSPTYSWVGWPLFPFGLIAAAIVAGIYGDRALKMLAEIEKQEALIKTASLELQIAKAVQAVQHNANTGVEKAQEFTDTAIVQTNIVRNAWLGISSNLQAVKDKLTLMTNTADGDANLRAIALIQTYANVAGKRWAELMPAVNQLTDEPYITVKQEDVSIAELIAEIKENLAANPANN